MKIDKSWNLYIISNEKVDYLSYDFRFDIVEKLFFDDFNIKVGHPLTTATVKSTTLVRTEMISSDKFYIGHPDKVKLDETPQSLNW